MSLQRTRADWPIVAAAWLITLLSAALLSAGPVYSSAASTAGLQQTLADAPGTATSIQVSLYGAPADIRALDDLVRPELERAIAPVGGGIVGYGRGSNSLALPTLPGSESGDRADLGFLDELDGHATLVAGAWPVESLGPAEPIQMVALDAVARELHLTVGDGLSLVNDSSAEHLAVPVRLVGIFTVDALADRFWYGDTQLTVGIQNNGEYRTFGPFLTTPNDFLQRAGIGSVYMRWRTFPDLERLTLDESAGLRGRFAALPEHLRIATGKDPVVATGLPAILGDAERSLLVTRSAVLLLMAQLAVLAAYAIILTASLLVDHRRIDTALLRSRGAGPAEVALLALAEGLLVAVPAVLVAPWLAVAGLSLLNVAGPLADVSLRLVPRVSLDAYVAAAVAGIVCMGLLVLPALLAARGFAAEQSGLSRHETRPFGQRVGLDVALLAVTGIALWQLRLYGAPLTRTVKGSLGVDPLLVAAPAIGLVAGGVLALRILPLLAQAVESVISRGRALVGSLGSRQMARRPLRYTRSALLLMLAVSMGVFALSYAATWSTSQREQAEYQTGADVRVTPGDSPTALPAWSLAGAYAGLGDVKAATAVERMSDGVSFLGAGSADLMALDADAASGIVLLRPDESGAPLGQMMRTLRAARPEARFLTLADGIAYLRIVPRLGFGSVSQIDPFTGEVLPDQLDPAALVGLRLSASAVLRDAHGLLYRVESGLVPMDGPAQAIVLALKPTTDRNARAVAQVGARLDGPLGLVGLGVDLWLPPNAWVTEGLFGIAGVWAGVDPAGPWKVMPDNAWSAKMAEGLNVLDSVPADQVQGTTVQLNVERNGGLVGFGGGPSLRLSFLPPSLSVGRAPVPVIANRAFLATTASAPGDVISATVEGAAVSLSIAGVVETFPTTDPDRPLLVFDEPTLGLLRLEGSSTARTADEWWMAAAVGNAEALAGELRSGPFDGAEVVSAVDRTRSLSTDPVALGIIGALSLGSVATGLLAVIGLTVSAAVSARQRRTEFALLRALGLSGRQLSGSLWLENGSLVIVSLLAGTSLGLLIGWLVLPFVTVTQRATAPIPPVIVQVPWDRILLLDIVSGLALGIAVIAIGSVLRRLGFGSVLRMGED